MKLPGDNQSMLPRTRRMNGCGQTEAAHCVVALKLNSLCLSTLVSLVVDMTVIYRRGLGGSWSRSTYMGLPFFCAVAPGMNISRGTVPPETAVGIAHALHS